MVPVLAADENIPLLALLILLDDFRILGGVTLCYSTAGGVVMCFCISNLFRLVAGSTLALPTIIRTGSIGFLSATNGYLI